MLYYNVLHLVIVHLPADSRERETAAAERTARPKRSLPCCACRSASFKRNCPTSSACLKRATRLPRNWPMNSGCTARRGAKESGRVKIPRKFLWKKRPPRGMNRQPVKQRKSRPAGRERKVAATIMPNARNISVRKSAIMRSGRNPSETLAGSPPRFFGQGWSSDTSTSPGSSSSIFIH